MDSIIGLLVIVFVFYNIFSKSSSQKTMTSKGKNTFPLPSRSYDLKEDIFFPTSKPLAPSTNQADKTELSSKKISPSESGPHSKLNNTFSSSFRTDLPLGDPLSRKPIVDTKISEEKKNPLSITWTKNEVLKGVIMSEILNKPRKTPF